MKFLSTILSLVMLASLPGITHAAEDLTSQDAVVTDLSTFSEERLNHPLLYTEVGGEFITEVKSSEDNVLISLSNGVVVKIKKPKGDNVSASYIDIVGNTSDLECSMPGENEQMTEADCREISGKDIIDGHKIAPLVLWGVAYLLGMTATAVGFGLLIHSGGN